MFPPQQTGCRVEKQSALTVRHSREQRNRRFGRALAQAEKAWCPAPRDVDRICCFLHERIVSNDNVVQWDGRRFQIPPQPRRFSFAGARVQLVQDLAGRIAVYHGDGKLQVQPL
jgi:hypothetical protein